MGHPYWPLFDLRIRTPRLELRLPDADEAVELARLSGQGVHDPNWMPFTLPWTDAPNVERGSMQWYWRGLGTWTAEDWVFNPATFVGGAIVGTQGIMAKEFGKRRTAETGSWLGLAHQGQGIGKEMRAAALQLIFDGLGASVAYSAAWEDNAPSLGVSRALGYVDNGDEVVLRRGEPARMIKLKLPRERWQRRDDIAIENLEPCLELFGLG